MASAKTKRYPVKTIRVFLRVFSWLPLRFVRWLGGCVAWVAWHSNARAARTTQQNIQHCYPELSNDEQLALARRSLRHTAYAILEMPAVWRSSHKRIKAWFQSVEGLDLLKKRVAEGSLLLIVPHFGNWEVLAAFFSEHTPYSCLYSPRRLYELDEFINECRSRFGAEFLPVTPPGLKKLVQRVQSGAVLLVLPDQVPNEGRSVVSSFKNRPLNTGTLPHELLRRGNLKALVVAGMRCRKGFDVHIHEVDDEIYSDDAEVSARALDRAIEGVIELDPAQYQWEYKRFRGQAEIYS